MLGVSPGEALSKSAMPLSTVSTHTWLEHDDNDRNPVLFLPLSDEGALGNSQPLSLQPDLQTPRRGHPIAAAPQEVSQTDEVPSCVISCTTHSES